VIQQCSFTPIAQAWVQRLNPQLEGRSPAQRLREEDLDEVGPQVVAAARPSSWGDDYLSRYGDEFTATLALSTESTCVPSTTLCEIVGAKCGRETPYRRRATECSLGNRWRRERGVTIPNGFMGPAPRSAKLLLLGRFNGTMLERG
jgi:hypothetical protein